MRDVYEGAAGAVLIALPIFLFLAAADFFASPARAEAAMEEYQRRACWSNQFPTHAAECGQTWVLILTVANIARPGLATEVYLGQDGPMPLESCLAAKTLYEQQGYIAHCIEGPLLWDADDAMRAADDPRVRTAMPCLLLGGGAGCFDLIADAREKDMRDGIYRRHVFVCEWTRYRARQLQCIEQ